MEKHARQYMRCIDEYDDARQYLLLLILFSVANIFIYYLASIRWIGVILDYVGWNNYLAPAASLPRTLLLRYFDQAQWFKGILLTALSLVPYLLTWWLSDHPGNKSEYFRGWAFLPAIIWYSVDSLLHWYGVVLSLISAFSLGVIFWEVISLILRLFVFAFLINGATIPKQIRNTWKDLEAQMLVCYILQHGPEAGKQLPKEALTDITMQYCNQVQKVANRKY